MFDFKISEYPPPRLFLIVQLEYFNCSVHTKFICLSFSNINVVIFSYNIWLMNMASFHLDIIPFTLAYKEFVVT